MDDLLDLTWNSTTSSAGKADSAPAGSSSSRSGGVPSKQPAYNAFDSLAAASSRSNGANYYASSIVNSTSDRYTNTRSPSPAISISKPASQTDAFSSLFDNGTGASSSKSGVGSSSLTLQQQMAMQRNLSLSPKDPSGAPSSLASNSAKSDLWDFDMLSPSTASASQSKAASLSSPGKSAIARASSPFDDLDAFASSASNMRLHDSSHTSNSFTSNQVPSQRATAPDQNFGFDDDDNDDVLGLLGRPASEVTTKTSARQTPSPALPGEIASPIPVRSAGTASGSNSSTRPPSRAVAARTPSPPPHVLGQIVMMGFPVQQARQALAATLGSNGGSSSGGWNVEAALELLASDGAAAAEMQQQQQQQNQSGSRTDHRSVDMHDSELEEYERKEARRAQQRQRGLRQERSTANSDNLERFHNGDERAGQPDILAQASSIGFSMLKSANAYWKTSKAQLAKAVEENKYLAAQAQAFKEKTGSGRSTPINNGRPKWMTDTAEEVEPERSQRPTSNLNTEKTTGGFRDDSDDEDQRSAVTSSRHRDPSSRSTQQVSNGSRSSQRTKAAEVNLFEQDTSSDHRPARNSPPVQTGFSNPAQRFKDSQAEAKVYSSPHRRRQPVQSSLDAVKAAPPSGPMNGTQTTVDKPRSPKPLRRTRPVVEASSSQVSAANQARMRGNEHFKLGRYGESVDAYTTAVSKLPEGHLGRVNILNNRANARLKIGEEPAACRDASEVLQIILGGDVQAENPTRETYRSAIEELAVDPDASQSAQDQLDARDALGKALSRRARGYEASEKWRLAMLDWQALSDLGDPAVMRAAGGIKVVSEGLARCKKTVGGGGGASASGNVQPTSAARSKSQKPPPQRKPVIATMPASSPAQSSRPSAAVIELRQNAAKAEADDNERIRIKDEVDNKISSWRDGKETNLRALIATLDSILWPELGWKKVGMHELLSDSQLKVRYVRAISKVHPDKVGNNATVEQKMIAAAVFSTLSDAWNATQ